MGPQPEPVAVVPDLQVARVVLVGALGVDQLAEEPGADHPEDGHLLAHVVDVLHHDAVLAGALRGLHELPALFEGDRGGDLGGGVLAVAHRGQEDRGMPLPGGGVVDQVEILGPAHALEVTLAPRVGGRLPLARLPGHPAGRVARLLADIADGHQLHAGDAEQVGDVLRPLDADADEADADRLDRLRSPRRLARGRSPGRPPRAAQRRRPEAGAESQEVSPAARRVHGVRPGPKEEEARRLIL